MAKELRETERILHMDVVLIRHGKELGLRSGHTWIFHAHACSCIEKDGFKMDNKSIKYANGDSVVTRIL